jgi:hypothetical protein
VDCQGPFVLSVEELAVEDSLGLRAGEFGQGTSALSEGRRAWRCLLTSVHSRASMGQDVGLAFTLLIYVPWKLCQES